MTTTKKQKSIANDNRDRNVGKLLAVSIVTVALLLSFGFTALFSILTDNLLDTLAAKNVPYFVSFGLTLLAQIAGRTIKVGGLVGILALWISLYLTIIFG